jgi:hypothetical protein
MQNQTTNANFNTTIPKYDPIKNAALQQIVNIILKQGIFYTYIQVLRILRPGKSI